MSLHTKKAILVFVIFRILLSFWAIVSLQINPLPEVPDEVLRPYLGQPILSEGQAGLWMGPWQRFDALRYTRIAEEGYSNEEDSVFPPLYPTLSRVVGSVLGEGHVSFLLGSIIVSNVATIALFWLIVKISQQYFSAETATRSLIYYALFPSAFFLFAPYTESLFILFAIGAVWQAINGRFLMASLLGLLAALTRLTGIILIIPLFIAWWDYHERSMWPIPSFWQDFKKIRFREWMTGILLFSPALGTALFLFIRNQLNLRPLPEIYQEYWFQTANFPGSDIWRALETMFFNGTSRTGEITLWLDFFTLLFLMLTTYLVFKWLGPVWGSYNLMLIAFLLLPTSDLKPLYSFSRYALAFIPTFWVMAQAGERPFINRLVLYTSLPLFLYLSGQFFIWGWVA